MSPRSTSTAPRPAADPPEAARERRGEGAAVLVLRWSLSRRAAAAAGLTGAEGRGEPALEVRVPWDGSGVERVRAAIVDGERAEPVGLERVEPGVWADEAGAEGTGASIRHIDLPGVLRLSAVLEGDRVRVLYARTELLGRLGLAGGRYDLERTTLICELA